MSRFPAWFSDWLRSWAAGMRRQAAMKHEARVLAMAHYNRSVADSIAAVRAAQAKRDTRAAHDAVAAASAARLVALRAELRR